MLHFSSNKRMTLFAGLGKNKITKQKFIFPSYELTSFRLLEVIGDRKAAAGM